LGFALRELSPQKGEKRPKATNDKKMGSSVIPFS
jgi:hypothetical protein